MAADRRGSMSLLFGVMVGSSCSSRSPPSTPSRGRVAGGAPAERTCGSATCRRPARPADERPRVPAGLVGWAVSRPPGWPLRDSSPCLPGCRTRRAFASGRHQSLLPRALAGADRRPPPTAGEALGPPQVPGGRPDPDLVTAGMPVKGLAIVSGYKPRSRLLPRAHKLAAQLERPIHLWRPAGDDYRIPEVEGWERMGGRRRRTWRSEL